MVGRMPRLQPVYEDIPLQSIQTQVRSTRSTHHPSSPIRHMSSNLAMATSPDDVLLNLARQSAHIEKALQRLLDAQSEGLLAGLGRPSATKGRPAPIAREATSESGYGNRSTYTDYPDSLARSSIASPTRRSKPSRIVTPVRQPPAPKPPTLREARLGILQNLRSLAGLKADEAEVFRDQVTNAAGALAHVAELEGRRTRLHHQISKFEEEDGIGRDDSTAEPEETERTLERNIRNLEQKLEDMKARLRYVRRERQKLENKKAAQLSSWRNALGEIEKQINEDVLSGRSLQRQSGVKLAKTAKGKEKQSVWDLPRDRRTIEMIRESIEAEKASASNREIAAEVDGNVCDQGARVWEGVVANVTALEKKMRRELRGLRRGRNGSSSTSTSASTPTTENPDAMLEHNGSASERPENGMSKLLGLMDGTIEYLTESLAKAEENSWSLLICSIGAETEALREGRDILSEALGEPRLLHTNNEDTTSDSQVRRRTAKSSMEASMHTAQESPLVDAGEASTNGSGEQPNAVHRSKTSTSEEEPDPMVLFTTTDEGDHGHDLLISHD